MSLQTSQMELLMMMKTWENLKKMKRKIMQRMRLSNSKLSKKKRKLRFPRHLQKRSLRLKKLQHIKRVLKNLKL